MTKQILEQQGFIPGADVILKYPDSIEDTAVRTIDKLEFDSDKGEWKVIMTDHSFAYCDYLIVCDYKGFGEHVQEWDNNGIPYGRKELVELAKRYNTPMPQLK